MHHLKSERHIGWDMVYSIVSLIIVTLFLPVNTICSDRIEMELVCVIGSWPGFESTRDASKASHAQPADNQRNWSRTTATTTNCQNHLQPGNWEKIIYWLLIGFWNKLICLLTWKEANFHFTEAEFLFPRTRISNSFQPLIKFRARFRQILYLLKMLPHCCSWPLILFWKKEPLKGWNLFSAGRPLHHIALITCCISPLWLQACSFPAR